MVDPCASSAETVFVQAARDGELAIVELWSDVLITDIDCRSADGWTALLAAVSHGHVEIARFLLQRGASTESRTCQRLTPLHVAALRGNIEMVELLCRFGADVNARGLRDAKTALHFAVENGFIGVVLYLVNHVVSGTGDTIFMRACLTGDHQLIVSVVKELDEAGARDANRCLVNKPRTADHATPLHAAARRGDLHLVALLIYHGADLETKETLEGFTPLSAAVHAGHEAVVRFLLSKGANPEATDVGNRTPLVIASKNDFRGIVTLLLDRGAKIDHRDINGFSALLSAVLDGRTSTVALLLNRKANLEIRQNEGWTPLLQAAGNGNLEVARCLIEDGAEVNSKSDDQWTPLTLAVRNGHTAVSELLLTNGASTKSRTKDSLTSIHLAYTNVEMIDLLCRFKADVNALDSRGLNALHIVLQLNRVPLHAAANVDILSLVVCLVKHGIDLEMKNAYGCSALHVATQEGHTDVVQFLLRNGARTETTDQGSGTPLMHASIRGFERTAKLILKSGARVDHKDINGFSALHAAVMSGHAAVVRLLLKHGADPKIRHNDGATPLLAAAQNGNAEVVRLLLDAQTDVNSQSYDHWTPLGLAVVNGHTAVCTQLLEQGASTTLSTTNGQRALHLAASTDRQEIIRVLLLKGAEPNARDLDGRTPDHLAMLEGYFFTAKLLKQAHGVVDTEFHDPVWSRHSLLELYDMRDATEHQTKILGQDPPWYIDHLSIASIEPCPYLSTPIATVSVGTWSGSRVMIVEPKIIKLTMDFRSNVKEAMKQRFREEVSKLYPLRHPHVIRLYGANHRGRKPFLVMEELQNGTLRSFVAENKQNTWKILHQVALGLQYLHERGIVHGDLMGDNIRVGDDGLVKLSGFGYYSRSLTSVVNHTLNTPPVVTRYNRKFEREIRARGVAKIKSLSEKSPHSSCLRGDCTDVWNAPEVILGQVATFESDVYSLGMCVIEAVSGESPYALEEAKKRNVKNLVNDGVAPTMPAALTALGWELVLRMICYHPPKRLKISDVVRELFALAKDEGAQVGSAVSGPTNKYDIDEAFLRAFSLIDGHDTGCDDNEETETPQRQVLRRLVDARHASANLQPSTFQLVRRRLQDILTRFTNDLQEQSSLSKAARFATQRQYADRVFSFQNEIDRLINTHSELLGARASTATMATKTHSWRERWHAHRRAELEALGASLQDMSGLNVETATCLLFELTKRRDAYTSISPQAILAACNRLRLMPGVHLPDWFIPHYEVIWTDSDPLGQGGFAVVYLGEWMGSWAIVKKVKVDNGPAFEKEVELWSQLYHPHVLQLYGACHVGQKVLVSEFAEHGRLDRYLLDLAKQPPKRRREVWRTLYEAALGLIYLHSRGIVHCDLKCDNILIGRDLKAKMSDYGLSQKQQNDAIQQSAASKKSTEVGAPRWKAPEVLNGAEPTVESDIYGFGMCVVEAVTGQLPWGVDDKDDLVSDHVRDGGDLFDKPRGFTDAQWTLVVGACRFDPKERLPLSEIIVKLQAFAKEAQDTPDTPDDATLSELEAEATPSWCGSSAAAEETRSTSVHDSWDLGLRS